MKKAKNWMIGLTIVALLTLGVAALGNGFRGGAAASEQAAPETTCVGLDDDGDGTINCQDDDWPGQGAACGGGAGLANGQGRCGVLSLDGSGFGPGCQLGYGMGQKAGCGGR